MKVITLDEKSIHDIGHAFGYYDYEQEAKIMKKEETKQFIRWCIAAAVYEKKHSAYLAG